MRRIHRVLKRVNFVELICNQLFGEQHTHRHRMTVGVVVMCIGVTVARGSTYIEYEIVRVVGDLVGYLIHGLGGVPFADYLMERARTNAIMAAKLKDKPNGIDENIHEDG